MNLKAISLGLVAILIGGWVIWQSYPQRGQIGGEAVDFFESHGNWEALCDQLPDNPQSARCYLRLIDVYSPRPDFGAYVGFITLDDDNDQEFELSLEPGATLTGKGFNLNVNGNETWMLDQSLCKENQCNIGGVDLGRMVNAAQTAQSFEVSFIDKSGKQWQRNLSSSDFTKAYNAFLSASKSR